jgi:hypothetical protein
MPIVDVSVPCIRCGAGDSRVVDTRQRRHGFRNRRRVCTACGVRWTTVEVPERVFLRVIRLSRQLPEALADLLGPVAAESVLIEDDDASNPDL